MSGVPIIAHAEETADLVHGEEQSTIKWYLDQEGFDRIRAGMACGNCLEPFPAPPSIRTTSIWRDHAHEYSGIRTKDELLDLVLKGRCPICKSEVSSEMVEVNHRGVDPFAPTEGAY
ncbi:hypothetical protein UFOVP929_28 [uncultured Caudovirales phage]|uniref:Uncharacterized protein n=1 Tax=uncultured Caudovirales phage TaxID=2100421 RepID=A0A6J5PRL0_9CAUD|nr:hypothetical protein UFOVP929_28 [uncultured Caudovirales phage]